jgi:hypothetical protein
MVKTLLDVAVHASTAVHEEPRSFVVVHSGETKSTLRKEPLILSWKK